MNKLSNFDLQIISKYLDYENTKELLKLNTSLRYSFDSTLNYITFKFEENIFINNNSIEQIIEKLLNIFPNLREIILNFKLENHVNDEYSNKILFIYQNFSSVVKNKNINIKINFNHPLHVFIDYNYTIDKFKEWLDKIVGVLKNSIFICFGSICGSSELHKLCEKYKTINFVEEMVCLPDEKYKDNINNTLFKPEIKNLYYSYFSYQPFFKTIDEYYKNLYLYEFKNIIHNVKYFPKFYSNIKIKKLLKIELLKYNNSIDLNLLNIEKYITSNYKFMNENMRLKLQILDKQLLEFLNKGNIEIHEICCNKFSIFKRILSEKYCDNINRSLFICIKKISINNEIIYFNNN